MIRQPYRLNPRLRDQMKKMLKEGQDIRIVRVYRKPVGLEDPTSRPKTGFAILTDENNFNVLHAVTGQSVTVMQRVLQELYKEVMGKTTEEEEELKLSRKCLVCRQHFLPPHKNIYMCDLCRDKVNRMHDGHC